MYFLLFFRYLAPKILGGHSGPLISPGFSLNEGTNVNPLTTESEGTYNARMATEGTNGTPMTTKCTNVLYCIVLHVY